MNDMNDIKVAQNFRLKEFECKDGSHLVMLHSELLLRLQDLRSSLGRAVIITSGYRTEEHNTRVGGTAGSLHLKGMAADIVVRGLSPQELARAARQAGFRGIGIYNNFLHVDIRQHQASW